MEDDLKYYIKSEIFQQPQVGFFPNLKPIYRNVVNEDDLQCKMTSNIKIERQPQISKVIYLSNHWPDLSKF
jgi:hypothetical protein